MGGKEDETQVKSVKMLVTVLVTALYLFGHTRARLEACKGSQNLVLTN